MAKTRCKFCKEPKEEELLRHVDLPKTYKACYRCRLRDRISKEKRRAEHAQKWTYQEKHAFKLKLHEDIKLWAKNVGADGTIIDFGVTQERKST